MVPVAQHHVLRVLHEPRVGNLGRRRIVAGAAVRVRFEAAVPVPLRFTKLLWPLWFAHRLDAVGYEAVLLPDEQPVTIRVVKELGRHGVVRCAPGIAIYGGSDVGDLELLHAVRDSHTHATEAKMIRRALYANFGAIQQKAEPRVEHGGADAHCRLHRIDDLAGVRCTNLGPRCVERRSERCVPQLDEHSARAKLDRARRDPTKSPCQHSHVSTSADDQRPVVRRRPRPRPATPPTRPDRKDRRDAHIRRAGVLQVEPRQKDGAIRRLPLRRIAADHVALHQRGCVEAPRHDREPPRSL